MHHLPDEVLVDYAAGALTEGLSLLVATHCTLCAACRAKVEAYEGVGGDALFDLEPLPVTEAAELALLERIGPRVPRPVAPSDPVLPAPLLAHTGPLAEVPFQYRIPQVGQHSLDVLHAGRAVQLLRLAPGFAVPRHQHEGFERTLVLAGGFTDDAGAYGTGDVAVHGPGVDHNQRIDRGEACIALVVNDGALIPRTLVGKLARWLTGL